MKIFSGKNLFLPAKTIFAMVFPTVWQKPANPEVYYPYSVKDASLLV